MDKYFPGIHSSRGNKNRGKLNPNVKTFFIFTGLQSFGRGIWMGNILSLYIVILAESSGGIAGFTPNELLGVTSAVTGLSVLVSVIPGGISADKWSIRGTLFIAIILGIIGLAILAFGNGIINIALGLFFWGLFQGVSRPAAETLMANSTVSGNRSGIFARAHFIDQIGMGSGPILNIILFLFLGDRWELAILQRVMTAGLFFSFLSCLMLINMREQHSLGDESEALSSKDPVKKTSKKDDTVDRIDPLHTPGGKNTEREKPGKHPAGSLRSKSRSAYASVLRKYVPHLFLASSFITGFGAGMTVKFFPVFFKDIYSLQPIGVQIVMGTTLLTTGIFTLFSQKFSRKRGRGEMIIGLRALSIGTLAAMAFYPALWIVIPLFIFRGALMNSAAPLSRSIVMDYVQKKRRGIWTGLQTVAWGLFWNVSAMAGGFLIGDNNYRLCFIITASIYTLGTLIIIPLVPLIHKETPVT